MNTSLCLLLRHLTFVPPEWHGLRDVNVICFFTQMGSSAPCLIPQTQNGQPCWLCALFFSEQSLKACPAWMALPMKANPHHNEQTSSVNPSTLQDVSSSDGRQTPTVSYSCTGLALYVGWQWMYSTVPCPSAATFHSQFLCYKEGQTVMP